jgi:hypothetical protein
MHVCCRVQVVVFDLEYGQPAASTTLPASRPAFRELLGCFGHAAAGKGLAEAGVDLLYASHQARLRLFWFPFSLLEFRTRPCMQVLHATVSTMPARPFCSVGRSIAECVQGSKCHVWNAANLLAQQQIQAEGLGGRASLTVSGTNCCAGRQPLHLAAHGGAADLLAARPAQAHPAAQPREQ